MAKDPTTTSSTPSGAATDGAAPAASAPATAAPAQKKFTIKTPSPTFKGERVGIKFMDGVGYTDDAIRAHTCLEFGYKIFYTETGKPAFEEEIDPTQDDGTEAAKKVAKKK